MLVCEYSYRNEGEAMKNNFFSEEDDMRPFIVKKMNLPPSSANKESDTEEQQFDKEQNISKEKPTHSITNKHVYDNPPHRKKSMFRSAKPLFVSILSAITIGVLLGFIILRLGAGGTDVDHADSQTPPTANSAVDTNKEENSSGEATTPVELGALQAYVLQAGVYSERENTDDVVSTFKDHGYTPIVWDQNDQYFVFTHVFATEEKAKQVSKQMEDKDLETYAKLWTTDKKTVDLSSEDARFVQDFVEVWTETVEKHANNETDFVESWAQLAEDMPTSDSNVQQLVTYVTDEIKETEVAIDIEQILFDTWQIYGKIKES